MARRRRYTRWMLLSCAVLCAWLGPWPVRADGPIDVQANEHDFAFGHQVRFHLKAQSDAPIQSVVLAYRTSDTRGTTVATGSFDPAQTVDVEHVHQVGERYIRPFVEITYWWTIEDAEGHTLTTDPQSLAYIDDRFRWQTVSQDVVNVYWYEGDVQIAQQVLEAALETIARVREDVPVQSISQPVDIYLYASAEDLRLALPDGLPLGAEALTLYETNVILAPYGPTSANIPALKRVVPHEMTHALIHEATQSGFGRVPMWLSEGLATSVEYAYSPDPDAVLLLDEALAEDRLLDLNALCAAFPSDPAEARLAYAQSASVVDYVRDLYGRQALKDLVAAYADGATCDGGVQRVLGFSLDHLEASWREHLAPRSGLSVFWQENGAWIILLALFAGILLLALGATNSFKGLRGIKARNR